MQRRVGGGGCRPNEGAVVSHEAAGGAIAQMTSNPLSAFCARKIWESPRNAHTSGRIGAMLGNIRASGRSSRGGD